MTQIGQYHGKVRATCCVGVRMVFDRAIAKAQIELKGLLLDRTCSNELSQEASDQSSYVRTFELGLPVVSHPGDFLRLLGTRQRPFMLGANVIKHGLANDWPQEVVGLV